MKVIADLTKCIGAGLCVSTLPQVFTQSEDNGLVMLLKESPSEEQYAKAREAVRLCPSLAITMVEE